MVLEDPNRFSGFRQGLETVEIETVLRLRPAQNIPLKQGVNDKMCSDNHLVCEMFRLRPLDEMVARRTSGTTGETVSSVVGKLNRF